MGTFQGVLRIEVVNVSASTRSSGNAAEGMSPIAARMIAGMLSSKLLTHAATPAFALTMRRRPWRDRPSVLQRTIYSTFPLESSPRPAQAGSQEKAR